jgi:hypothetical protein
MEFFQSLQLTYRIWNFTVELILPKILETGFRPAILIQQPYDTSNASREKKKVLGQQQKHAQKINKMETKVDRLNDGNPQPLRPPTVYHPAPSTESSSTKQYLQEGGESLLPEPSGPRVSPSTPREVDIR